MSVPVRLTLSALVAASLLVACSQPAVQSSADTVEVESRSAPTETKAEPVAPGTGLTAPVAGGAALAVDGEGLRLINRESGSATALPFGAPADTVLGPLERLRGAASRGTNEDCGAGPVQYASWGDGLSVVIQNGRFEGWGLDGRARGAISTASGIGPGSSRAELDAAYGDVKVSRTSLGQEFSAGGFSGVIDGSTAGSRITDMWAGVNCVAR